MENCSCRCSDCQIQGRCRRQYGVNSHRLLVRGHRVPYTEEMAQEIAAEQAPDSWFKRLPMQARHMVMGLVVILAVLIGRQLIRFLLNKRKE